MNKQITYLFSHFVRFLKGLGTGLLLLCFFKTNGQVTTQAVTKTGNFYHWSTTANWVSNAPPSPLTTLIDEPIVVNDYISRYGDLTFADIGANTDEIVVNDTLVVYGDIFFDMNAISLVNNGVIVVFGDFRSENKADITNNGTLIITGSLELNGGNQNYSDGQGATYGGLYVGNLPITGNSSGIVNATGDLETNLSNYGSEMNQFVSSGGSVPLPVKLISFQGRADEMGIRLTWLTATELNNDFFSVQRSEDGHSFYEIGKVQGNGTTDEMQVYTFTDNLPIASIEYYRLKQFDFDGAFEIHKTIVVQVGRLPLKLNAEIFPNPASERLELKFDRSVKISEMVLADLSGKQIIPLSVHADPDQKSFEAILPMVKPGIYHVRYKTPEGITGYKKVFIR